VSGSASAAPSLRALLVAGAVALAAGSSAPSAATYVEASDQVRARATYAVAAVARADDVPVGGTIRIVGSVETKPAGRPARSRPLVLQEKHRRVWGNVSTKASTRFGAYTFRVPAGGRPDVRTFRVRAPRSHGLPSVVTRPIPVEVVAKLIEPQPSIEPGTEDYDAAELLPEGYAGAGSARDWRYLFTGVSRWDPCQVIRWAYNPTSQGYDALADVQRAFAKIAGASGLRFKYVGPTTWRYLGDIDDEAFPEGTVDIVVGWADGRELPILARSVVGVGGALGSPLSGILRITRGYLTLDNGAVLPAGYGHHGWGQVMLHEVLHALGLGHASSDVQLMYGTAGDRNHRFGAGDLTGMRRIGEQAGCLSWPGD
jgi:hypothetical protein